MDDDELKHVGVLGMKWGRRKGDSSSKMSTKSSSIKSNYEKSLHDVRRVYDHKGSGKDPSKMTKKEIDSEIASISSRPVTPKIARNIYNENQKIVKRRMEAYNKAADYANKVLIPSINKKYGKYDWTKIDTTDPRNPKGDPQLVKSYTNYINEYEKSFKKVFDKKLSEIAR